MNAAILTAFIALNPCVVEGHPAMQTGRCIDIIPINPQSYNDCLEIEKSFRIKIRPSWPRHVRNLYQNGGGSPLSFTQCEEV